MAAITSITMPTPRSTARHVAGRFSGRASARAPRPSAVNYTKEPDQAPMVKIQRCSPC